MAKIKRSKAKKPWERDGVSRTTWYRRQKADPLEQLKREGNWLPDRLAKAEAYIADRQATLDAAKAGPPPCDLAETEQARIEREVEAQVAYRVQSMEDFRDKVLVEEFVRVFNHCNRTLDAMDVVVVGWVTAGAVCRALKKAGY